MSLINDVTNFLNGIIWSTPMIYLCLFTGIFFTFVLKGVQFRKIKEMIHLLLTPESGSDGLSSFQAFALAVGGRVGTGNIVGTVTAIAYGGPGALFWMWVLALLGAATAYAECSLAQVYKQKINGMYRGGGAYMIKYGMNCEILAVIFAICGFFGNAILHPGVQSDAISSAMYNAFGLNKSICGIIICVLLACVIFGGVKRVGDFASKVVPIMAILYVLVAIIMLIFNISNLPKVLVDIFASAFGTHAVFGGIVGSAIAWGIKRGVYSSEAGMGTAPHHAATAESSHPGKQGLLQAFSVYVDTLFVCSATGIMVLVTGCYNVEDASGSYLYEGLPGVEVGVGYVQAAINTMFPGIGGAFVAIALFFFAFTTLLAAYNIGEANLLYLFKNLRENKVAMSVFRIIFLLVTFFGAMVPTAMAWAWADIGLGSMVWITVITCMLMFKTVKKVKDDYEEQEKMGRNPVFRPSRLGIKNAEIWEEIADRYESKSASADR